MIDTDKLYKAISNFKFQAKHGSSDNQPCTNKNLHNAVDEVVKLMKIFVYELEKIEN